MTRYALQQLPIHLNGVERRILIDTLEKVIELENESDITYSASGQAGQTILKHILSKCQYPKGKTEA